MNPRSFGLVAIATLGLSGCMTINQNVRPVSQIIDDEVCIIENPKVQSGFIKQIKKTLDNNGYKNRVLPHDSGFKDCNIITIYTANWAWDFALYIAYAKITVYRAGQPLGNAVYDARKAGLNSDKFVRGHEKVDELVSQLFPKQSTVRERTATASSVAPEMPESDNPNQALSATSSRKAILPSSSQKTSPQFNRQLTAAELRSEWPNHTIVTRRATIDLKNDGTMSGEAKNGNSSDVGKYWITNKDKLCFEWERWRDGKTLCFHVRRDGDQYVTIKPDGTIGGRFNKLPRAGG